MHTHTSIYVTYSFPNLLIQYFIGNKYLYFYVTPTYYEISAVIQLFYRYMMLFYDMKLYKHIYASGLLLQETY